MAGDGRRPPRRRRRARSDGGAGRLTHVVVVTSAPCARRKRVGSIRSWADGTGALLGAPRTDRRSDDRDPRDDVISEALSVIDKALAEMINRELVSTGEVADVLLDVRSLLTMPAAQRVLTVRPAARAVPARRTLTPCTLRSRSGSRHRGRVHVQPHVQAAVVGQQRQVERHAGQRPDRGSSRASGAGDVARERRRPHVRGGEVDRLGLLAGDAGHERRRQAPGRLRDAAGAGPCVSPRSASRHHDRKTWSHPPGGPDGRDGGSGAGRRPGLGHLVSRS